MKEKIEHVLSEILAVLCGERVVVFLHKVGTDEAGQNYIDCYWHTLGSLKYGEGRIYEGAVSASRGIVPNHALPQILRKLGPCDTSQAFWHELTREATA